MGHVHIQKTTTELYPVIKTAAKMLQICLSSVRRGNQLLATLALQNIAIPVVKSKTYKGCSYFETAKEVADDIIGGVAYSTVKETCKSDNCNEKLYNKP